MVRWLIVPNETEQTSQVYGLSPLCTCYKAGLRAERLGTDVALRWPLSRV